MKYFLFLALTVLINLTECSFIFKKEARPETTTLKVSTQKTNHSVYLNPKFDSFYDNSLKKIDEQMTQRKLRLIKTQHSLSDLKNKLEDSILASKLAKNETTKKDLELNKEEFKSDKTSQKILTKEQKKPSLMLITDPIELDSQRTLNSGVQLGNIFEPEALETMIKESGGNQIVPTQIEQNHWILGIKKEDGTAGDPVCEIEMTPVENKTFLIHISNTDIDFLSFWKRTSMKQVGQEEKNQDVKDFLDSQFLLFVEDYAQMLQSQFVVVDLAQYFIDDVFGKNNMRLGLVAEANNKMKQPNVMYLGYSDPETGEPAAEVQLFRVNSSFNQVNLLFGDQDLSFQVPVIFDEADRENLKIEIQNILNEKLSKPVINLEIGLEIFESQVRSVMNCKQFFVQRENGNTSFLQIPSQNQPCMFGEMTFLLTGFDYGFAKYIHIFVDNDLFHSENLVPLTDYQQYTQNLTQIFNDMIELKNQMDLKVEQNEATTTLSIDDIAQIISETIGNDIERENLSDKEIQFWMVHNQVRKKIVKVLLMDSKEQQFFKISMFPPHSQNIQNHTHDEVMIYSDSKTADVDLLKKKLGKLVMMINGRVLI